MSNSDVWLVIKDISVFILCSCIYAPISVYNGYQYFKNRHKIIISKRYGNVTLYEVFFAVCKLMWVGIFSLWHCFETPQQFKTHHTFRLLFTGISYSLTICLDYCLFWRFYLLYFDIQCNVASINGKWQQLIDPNHTDCRYNFFVNKRKTFGNYNYIKYRVIIPLITISCFILLITTYSVEIKYKHDPQIFAYLNIVLLFDSILFLLPTISLIIIWFKTPKLEDHFFISNELRLLCWNVILYLSLYFICWFITTLCLEVGDVARQSIIYTQVMTTNSCIFAITMIATYWVNHKITPLILDDIDPGSNVLHSIPLIQQSMVYIGQKQLELADILAHAKGFELFMRHLSNEFSLENLLVLVECVQFEMFVYQYIMKKTDGDNNEKYQCNVEELWHKRIILPNNVPKSFIVHKPQHSVTDPDDECEFIIVAKKISHALYSKYVEQASEYEINIPYRLRYRLNGLMGNHSEWMNNDNVNVIDLLLMFNGCCDEVFGLMQDTYMRFKSTQQYQHLATLIFV